ncbi:MAG: hypothetical protein V3573_13405 [Desulfovibrionaceae bacterium]
MEISGVGYMQSAAAMQNMGGMRGPKGPPPDSEEMAAKMSEQMMSEQDADGDGILSLEETGLSEDVFSELDTNGDGTVDAEDLNAGVNARFTELRTKMAENMAANSNGEAPGMPGMENSENAGGGRRLRASQAYQEQQRQAPSMSMFFEGEMPSPNSGELSVAV